MRLSVSEAIRLMLDRAKKSMAQISRELGLGTPANVVSMVARGGVKMKVGAAIGEACGYTLMYVPNSEVGKIENGIEIKGETE